MNVSEGSGDMLRHVYSLCQIFGIFSFNNMQVLDKMFGMHGETLRNSSK
jgi:hypothetical protein